MLRAGRVAVAVAVVAAQQPLLGAALGPTSGLPAGVIHDSRLQSPCRQPLQYVPFHQLVPWVQPFSSHLLELSTDVGGFNRIQRCQNIVRGDASAGNHLGAGSPHR
jgi:hypothetical protein